MKNEEQAAPPVSSEQDSVTDLDRIMTDGRASFDDVVAPEDARTASPAQEADLLVGEPGSDLLPSQSEAKPQEQAAPPNPPAPPAQPATPEPPRFKSHEEAETGYKNLQRDKTIVDQRVKALTEEIQRIKSQEQMKQDREAEETAFMGFAQARNEQALKEIDELDPDDPEYRKKAASAWARANKDIRYFSNTSGKPPQSGIPAQNQQPAPPAPAALPPQADQDASAEAVSYVKEKLTAAKIPQDDLLFWKIARDVPATDPQGKPLDLDTQINLAIAETQNYRAAILGNTGISPDAAAEADRKARATQAQHLPLGRSSADRAAVTPPAAPVSMTDAISFAQEQRRL